jgi:hypothetical protein
MLIVLCSVCRGIEQIIPGDNLSSRHSRCWGNQYGQSGSLRRLQLQQRRSLILGNLWEKNCTLTLIVTLTVSYAEIPYRVEFL